MAKKKKYLRKLEEIPTKDIQQGPLRHKKGFTPLLEEIARNIFMKVGHFAYPTFEQWELGFMRDLHPWREILIWETIARAFDRYVDKHPEAAQNEKVVGTLISITVGQVPETDEAKELHNLFIEACKGQWTVPPGEPFAFPENEAVMLQFEDIVDEWDGGIHPNIRKSDDPRRILTDADIILGMEPSAENQFCIYGRDILEEGRIPWGYKTVIIQLDSRNEKTMELEKICYVVEKIKGRHDCQ